MSSAALHSPPHQPTLTSPPLSSSSNCQYGSPHSSPSREAYNAHQTATASPSSRGQASHNTSGNGGPPSADLNMSRSSRNGPSAYSPQEQRSPRSDRPVHMAPVAPPRTSSSSQQDMTSRRGQHANDPIGSRHRQADSPRSGSRGDTNGYLDTSKTKRTTAPHLAQEPDHSSSRRETRGPELTIPIRSNSTAESKPSRRASNTYAEEPNGRPGHHSSPQAHHDAAPRPSWP